LIYRLTDYYNKTYKLFNYSFKQMKKMRIMVNGLPGKMATEVANQILKSEDLELFPYSLTGPEITPTFDQIGNLSIALIPPEMKEKYSLRGLDISVDFTRSAAANLNAGFYCNRHLPFVMGTSLSSVEKTALEQRVKDSDICAVIAPNMAKQIVAFQAMMEFAANNFPEAFKGYSLKVVESHQAEKKGTSATASAMVEYFNKLGIPFTKDGIEMIRDKEKQIAMGIPEEALSGHGWHTYTSKSENGNVLFRFEHNVNGRGVYAEGTLDAIRYLGKKIALGKKGEVYSMINVLEGR
jgi:4-hydroxy-tetrahydrodipicolinate reductase